MVLQLQWYDITCHHNRLQFITTGGGDGPLAPVFHFITVDQGTMATLDIKLTPTIGVGIIDSE